MSRADLDAQRALFIADMESAGHANDMDLGWIGFAQMFADQLTRCAFMGWQAARASQAPAVQQEPVVLTVWYGPMPESNGKSNFTAILNRKGATGIDQFDGFTIARSEYPDRVRYDADCVRHLIGELAEKPWITEYDGDKHSGYVAPSPQGDAELPPLPECWCAGSYRHDFAVYTGDQMEAYARAAIDAARKAKP